MKENSVAVKNLFAFDELRAGLKKKREESLKVLGVQIAACEKGLKAVLANPTKLT
jgi:hypothetical protein